MTKLNAYEVDKKSLRFSCSYLQNSKQRTKVNRSCSRFSKIINGVPQGSVLGPLPFSRHIFDMSYESRDISALKN